VAVNQGSTLVLRTTLHVDRGAKAAAEAGNSIVGIMEWRKLFRDSFDRQNKHEIQDPRNDCMVIVVVLACYKKTVVIAAVPTREVMCAPAVGSEMRLWEGRE
jgi:hypothetical protein